MENDKRQEMQEEIQELKDMIEAIHQPENIVYKIGDSLPTVAKRKHSRHLAELQYQGLI